MVLIACHHSFIADSQNEISLVTILKRVYIGSNDNKQLNSANLTLHTKQSTTQTHMKLRRIIFLAYDGFELLDLSGPAAVFSNANFFTQQQAYRVLVASPSGGLIRCQSGLHIDTRSLKSLKLHHDDTVLVMGAEQIDLLAALQQTQLLRYLQNAAIKAERCGSICSGTFLLAQAGLINEKCVSTHWQASAKLAKLYPHAHVHAHALYSIDGNLWTSAGASTGIDMALAMVEQDHGSTVMGEVAKKLVLYAKRPGYQSQFSQVLQAQTDADGHFSDLVMWLQEHLDTAIRVADMAQQCGMSERNFHRKFTEQLGITPAKFLENLRLERAKVLLEANLAPKVVAQKIGFQSESAFRSAFRSQFGITPNLHRTMQKTSN
jgi:transcriptional regulator GlxA family with amidase domain